VVSYGDERDVSGGIVGHFRKQQRIDRKRAAQTDANGVAVGVRLSHHIGSGVGAGAWPVLDHERLTELPLHVVADQPPDHVRRRAGTKRHDDPHGFRGPVRRRGRDRSEQQRGECQRQAFIHQSFAPHNATIRSVSSLALLVFLRSRDRMISVITGEATASMDLPQSPSRSRVAPPQGPPCLATCHGLYWRRTQ